MDLCLAIARNSECFRQSQRQPKAHRYRLARSKLHPAIRIQNDFRSHVEPKTFIGGTRVVDMLSGEQLPRIC